MVRVEQLMTRELACIDSTQAVSAASQVMRVKKIYSLLVMQGFRAYWHRHRKRYRPKSRGLPSSSRVRASEADHEHAHRQHR